MAIGSDAPAQSLLSLPSPHAPRCSYVAWDSGGPWFCLGLEPVFGLWRTVFSLAVQVRQKAARHPGSPTMSPLSCQPACQLRLRFLTAAHGVTSLSLSLIINSCSNLNPSWGMLSRGPARGWMLGRRQIRVCRRQGRKPSSVVRKTSGGYLRRRRGLWPISQMLLLKPESNSPSPSQPSLDCHRPCPIPAPNSLFPSVLPFSPDVPSKPRLPGVQAETTHHPR